MRDYISLLLFGFKSFRHLDLVSYSNGGFYQHVDESMGSSSPEARVGAQVPTMVSL